jgi:dihydroflavonol-4-reductase
MILLTGATGFLGRYLIEELLAGQHEVRALVRQPARRKLPWASLVEVIEGDVLDTLSLERACEGVSAVVHAAAMVSFDKRDRDQVMNINARGTANVVDACLEMGVPRLVQVSSIAAVGRAKAGKIIDEETPWNPKQARSTYAKSKRQAEMEVHRGVAEGLEACMLNPAVILGGGNNWDAGPPRLFKTVAKGLKAYNPGVNGFVGAADVAKACRLLLESDLSQGERFILSAENLSYRELFFTIAQALEVPPPRIGLPAWLVVAAGWLAERWASLSGQAPFLTVETARSGITDFRYDGSKITQLGLQYTPIEEVIAQTAREFRAAGK